MPDKEGAEEKTTKSVVSKRQKQMMGEEGYDIARDMGRVRPSKDKKDATTMPPSKEMRKTQKVNKGPSALELVKKKYKGQIMNVGKKKVKEELDLTQVAEAFGGYIIEANGDNTTKKSKKLRSKEAPPIRSGTTDSTAEFEKSFRRTKAFRQLTPDQKAGRLFTRTPSLRSGFDTVELENPDDKTKQSKLDQEAKKRTETGKKQSTSAFTNEPLDNVKIPSEVRDPKTGETLTKDTPPTKQEIERKTKEVKDQSRKTRGSKEPLIRQTEFTSDTRRASEDPVTQGKGDGRKAGRTSQERKTGQVTYQTFVNKPEVTGNVDAKDSGETVTYTTPDKRKKRSDAGQKRVKKDKFIVKEPETQIKTEPQTQTQMGDGKPPKPPKVATSTGASGDTPKAFSSIKKFAKSNPQIAAAGALAGYDLGKGILSKIMNLRGPGLRGGTVGRRSAGTFTAT